MLLKGRCGKHVWRGMHLVRRRIRCTSYAMHQVTRHTLHIHIFHVQGTHGMPTLDGQPSGAVRCRPTMHAPIQSPLMAPVGRVLSKGALCRTFSVSLCAFRIMSSELVVHQGWHVACVLLQPQHAANAASMLVRYWHHQKQPQHQLVRPQQPPRPLRSSSRAGRREREQQQLLRERPWQRLQQWKQRHQLQQRWQWQGGKNTMPAAMHREAVQQLCRELCLGHTPHRIQKHRRSLPSSLIFPFARLCAHSAWLPLFVPVPYTAE